jgi:hypothetical protein
MVRHRRADQDRQDGYRVVDGGPLPFTAERGPRRGFSTRRQWEHRPDTTTCTTPCRACRPSYAIVNDGKASSSSRAAIKAWLEVDGIAMEPGMVVYADRLQATGLTVNLACQTSTPGETCTVTGNILLELFQRTKSAHAFTFFAGPLFPVIHTRRREGAGSDRVPSERNRDPVPRRHARRLHGRADDGGDRQGDAGGGRAAELG